MKKNLKKIFIIILIFIIFLGIIISFKSDNGEYIKYSEFYSNVQEKKVEKAEIGESIVKFKLKDNENYYYTDNPNYDNFKEFLLVNEVETEEEFNYYNLLDLMIYVVFLSLVTFVVVKFLKIRMATFKVIKHNKTRFSDIAGLDELKKDMIQTVDILKNPEKYKEKGIRAPKGIMLEGSPGNGKTLFARALAGEADINFIATKATDFQSAMMSVGPSKIKALFKKARKNAPCIVFIDEFDGIGEKRNYSGTGIDKENNRIITAMLNEMDGFEQKSGVLIIGATNSYNSLDQALIRAGRFDKKYVVNNPDLKTRMELIEIYTKNKKLSSDLNITKLAENFNGLSCSQIEAILNEAATISLMKKSEDIRQEDIIDAINKICNIKLNRLR